MAAAAGTPALVMRGHTGAVVDLDISPDSALLASASADRTARLWHTDTGGQVALLPHPVDVYAIRFSPDGAAVASGCYDGAVRLWHTARQQCTATLAGHTSWLQSLCFLPGGAQLASGSTDHTVRLWDIT